MHAVACRAAAAADPIPIAPIPHVRPETATRRTLVGRAPVGARLLDGRLGLLSTVGHELYHAIEIAGEPSIVDARTLARFYARVGTPSPPLDDAQTFETRAAADMGGRVRQALLPPPARSTNGS